MIIIITLSSISVTKCPVALLVNFAVTSGEKYGQIKVTKCPPNYYPWRVINSNPNPNLKIIRIQTPTPKLQTGGLCLNLAVHFVTFAKIEPTSIYAFLDLSGDIDGKVIHETFVAELQPQRSTIG